MQKQEKQNHTSQKGITLIALIITIIIMLILVIVTITISDTGGLFNYGGNAVRETQNAINVEQQLADGRIQIGDKWYASIGDYLNNNPEVITIEETLNLDIPADYDLATTPVTGQLTATLNEIESTVIWESDNEEVATVSNTGLVTAITEGTAKITAKVTFEGNEYTDECTVTVETQRVTISTTANYVGCYADFEGDGIIEGIIYADLAKGNRGDGEWGNNETYTIPVVTGLKEYYVSKTEHLGTFGTTPRDVLTATGEGNDRFYVMSLEDITTTDYTTLYWYYNAYGYLDRAVAESYNDFGEGKSNTMDMINAWNNTDPYGDQNIRDLWGVIQSSENIKKYPLVTNENDSKKWFVPSKSEWAAFGEELGITSSTYSDFGLGQSYWTSTQSDYWCVYAAAFDSLSIGGAFPTATGYVRLSATF